MKANIERLSNEEDFFGVYKLFDGRKSIKELKWLYSDPENNEIYNAFIAKTEENKVIGVIAYSNSLFKNKDKIIKGVTAFSWKVAPNIPGLHGLMLINNILSLGDFAYAIGGSKHARKFYPLLNYKKQSEYIKFYKVLIPRPLRLNRSKQRFGLKLNFEEYNENAFTFKDQSGIFQKQLTKGYVQWLLSCPLLDTYAFNVMQGKVNLGVCILYIKNINRIKVGRIVYLPFLGKDVKIWLTVINLCLEFFREKNCILVSTIGHHKLNQLGLKKSGFIANSPRKRPISVSDPNAKLESIEFNDWHIQFSEDDQSYSGFFNQRVSDLFKTMKTRVVGNTN